jgi:hypothetical protein
MDLSADHGLSIRDAVILSAAAAAGCRLLLSEDRHEGFPRSGVTVTDPFAAKAHELLGVRSGSEYEAQITIHCLRVRAFSTPCCLAMRECTPWRA